MKTFCMRHAVYEGIQHTGENLQDIDRVVREYYGLLEVNTDHTLTLKHQYDPDLCCTIAIGDLLLVDKATNKMCVIDNSAYRMLFNDVEAHIEQYAWRDAKHHSVACFMPIPDPYESALNPYWVDATAEKVMAVRYGYGNLHTLFKEASDSGNMRLDEVCLCCGKGWLKWITHPDAIVREGDWIILRETMEDGNKVTACQLLHDDEFRGQHSRV